MLDIGVLVPFSSRRDEIVVLMVFVIIVVVFVGVSCVSILIMLNDADGPYPIVIWASPALNNLMGVSPFPML